MKILSRILLLSFVLTLSTGAMAKKMNHKIFSFIPFEKGWHCHAVLWYSSSSSSSSSSDSCKHVVWIVENKAEKLNNFVANNASVLREQTAKGHGVVVNDYAKLLGCTNEKAFSKVLQNNYNTIFEKKDGSIIPETLKIITTDQSLSKSCYEQS
jgi:hypothetical protein